MKKLNTVFIILIFCSCGKPGSQLLANINAQHNSKLNSTVSVTSLANPTPVPSLTSSPTQRIEHTSTGANFTIVLDHPDLGNEAWQDSHGLIWGDVVRNENATLRGMTFIAAAHYCASIGARLPTREEYIRLRESMGAEAGITDFNIPHGYHPQILPNLHYWFWATSTRPSFPLSRTVFNGLNGYIGSTSSTRQLIVRCVR